MQPLTIKKLLNSTNLFFSAWSAYSSICVGKWWKHCAVKHSMWILLDHWHLFDHWYYECWNQHWTSINFQKLDWLWLDSRPDIQRLFYSSHGMSQNSSVQNQFSSDLSYLLSVHLFFFSLSLSLLDCLVNIISINILFTAMWNNGADLSKNNSVFYCFPHTSGFWKGRHFCSSLQVHVNICY